MACGPGHLGARGGVVGTGTDGAASGLERGSEQSPTTQSVKTRQTTHADTESPRAALDTRTGGRWSVAMAVLGLQSCEGPRHNAASRHLESTLYAPVLSVVLAHIITKLLHHLTL